MNDGISLEGKLQRALTDAAPPRAPGRLRHEIVTSSSRVRQRPRWLALIKEPPMRYRSQPVAGSATLRIALAVAITVGLLLALAVGVVGSATLLPSQGAGPVIPPTACPPGPALPGGTIATVAGGGTNPLADGVQATSVIVGQPKGIAVDSTGAIYFSDGTYRVIRRIAPDGVMTTVAGTGQNQDSGDGGPATSASFISPAGLAFDSAGNLYVTDPAAGRIRKIDAVGQISTVVGNGTNGTTGNDGPATSAQINGGQIGIGPDGTLYFDDSNNFRAVGPDGIIRAFAGSGTAGYSGDGGPAVDAEFGEVNGSAIDSAGDVYLGDAGGHRIRRVDPAGIVTTFAGSSTSGTTGDGGPATAATFSYPGSLAMQPAGDLYISDWGNAVVRKIGADGIIRAVAGTGGLGGFAGDCGPATSARLGGSGNLTIAVHDGVLYIGDYANSRIRIVTPQ